MSQTPGSSEREKSAPTSPSGAPIPVEIGGKGDPAAPSAAHSAAVSPAMAANGPTSAPVAGGLTLGTVGAPTKARELVQAIASDFYNVTDPEGKPVAGLLVLLDGKRRPVRAELHLGGSVTDESGRQAVREAQHILEERYAGPESIPLQVWQSFLRSEPLHVPLPPASRSLFGMGAAAGSTESKGSSEGTLPWRTILYGVGALLVVLLLWWIVSALRGDGGETATPESGGLVVPVETSDGGVAGDVTLEPVDTSIVGNVPATGNTTLAPSQFAPADIVPGRRVRMIPGFTQTVLSEPSAGTAVGEITPDTAVMVVGGPEQLQGEADTIVWLEVTLGNGVTGWVAANDSQKALLELAD